MRLLVLGSNGTYPTPGAPASGYVIEEDDVTIWLDAGPGTFPAALARGIPDRVDALVLSHVHADHCADVAPLFNYLRYGSRRTDPLPVFAPDGVVDRLAAFLGAGRDHEFHRLLPSTVVGPGDEVPIGALRLAFGRAEHPVPAVCTEVAGAVRFVYSGDTGPGGDLQAMATGADALLVEATWQGTPGPDRYPYHLSAAEAGAVARTAGVGRLIVTHIAPTLDPQQTVAEAAASFGGPVEHARPGTSYDIEAKGNM